MLQFTMEINTEEGKKIEVGGKVEEELATDKGGEAGLAVKEQVRSSHPIVSSAPILVPQFGCKRTGADESSKSQPPRHQGRPPELRKRTYSGKR